MASDSELDRMDEALEQFSSSEYSNSPSSSEEETDPRLARAAAVGPRVKRLKVHPEDQLALNANSWTDMEEEREYISKTHKSTFDDLILRLEDTRDVGDSVDLVTGTILHDTGHLTALKAQKTFLVGDLVTDEDIEEFEDEDRGLAFAVCQRPLVRLDRVLRWAP